MKEVYIYLHTTLHSTQHKTTQHNTTQHNTTQPQNAEDILATCTTTYPRVICNTNDFLEIKLIICYRDYCSRAHIILRIVIRRNWSIFGALGFHESHDNSTFPLISKLWAMYALIILGSIEVGSRFIWNFFDKLCKSVSLETILIPA